MIIAEDGKGVIDTRQSSIFNQEMSHQNERQMFDSY